ncbi:MAG: hypothetical protein LE168_03350 [Endomicrobium sp.]|nr:hypothetical protein [Endomicrobium sp.]
MSKFISVILIILMVAAISFTAELSGKTIITGDAMHVKKAGGVTISKGNSEAINDTSAMAADEMSYDKQSSELFATGNVRLVSRTQKGEPFEAYGNFAKYDMNTRKGKIWGDYTVIRYYVNNSATPLVMCAKEVYIDRETQTLDGYKDVEVVTSSGTIYADNGSFDSTTLGMTFKKDEKRPIANVNCDGRKGLYEADKIIFYDSEGNKRIIMNGSVVGKIEMENKMK